VKGNALRARTFPSLEAQNEFLREWEASVADTRIHGTTRLQVGKLFCEVERPALLALPVERFPFFHEGQRNVHRDGHVEVAKAYYSVPAEYVGRRVWVRWDSRMVRVLNHRNQEIAVHVRHQPGQFSTKDAHIPDEKIDPVERGLAWLLTKVRSIGPQTSAWAEVMLEHRGIAGVRVLQGLLALTRKHTPADLENACQQAVGQPPYRLREVRARLCAASMQQRMLPFLEAHPLIRPPAHYDQWLKGVIQWDPVPGMAGNGDRPLDDGALSAGSSFSAEAPPALGALPPNPRSFGRDGSHQSEEGGGHVDAQGESSIASDRTNGGAAHGRCAS
jgi:hypothetical protein